MNRHSTLVSYLEKLAWVLTGNLGQPGAQYAPATLVPIVRASKSELDPRTAPVSPVAGARILSGLVPCNVIPEEILTDHPRRYRALIVESGNPAHSLADSQRMRQALAALDVVVAIDVFMTETARLADYVLPAVTQFEKPEATFFNFEFPRNVFHLRRPLLAPPEGPLPEPEIHARLVEATGVFEAQELERAASLRMRERNLARLGRQGDVEGFREEAARPLPEARMLSMRRPPRRVRVFGGSTTLGPGSAVAERRGLAFFFAGAATFGVALGLGILIGRLIWG